jgi:TonB family protein
MMEKRGRCLAGPAALLGIVLCACGASSRTSASAAAGERTAVLLRVYYFPLQHGAMGNRHPPLTTFLHTGTLPGGQDGPAQRASLKAGFTLPDLGFQFSDAKSAEAGKEVVLQMGFGEQIQIHLGPLTRVGPSAYSAEFGFTFGRREVLRQTIPFKSGQALLFAGHLDASLPILSVISLEIATFPGGADLPMQNFLDRARKDREDFAPPPPQQRAQEPYLPGVGDVSLPGLVTNSIALYPDAARAEKLDGQVIVEVTVDREGRATQPKVLVSTSSVFEPAALEAAKTYRYHPALKNGAPVAVTMNLVMIFKYTAGTTR